MQITRYNDLHSCCQDLAYCQEYTCQESVTGKESELGSDQVVQVYVASSWVAIFPYGRFPTSDNHVWNFRDCVVLHPRAWFHLSWNSQRVNLEHVRETEGGLLGKHEQDSALQPGLMRQPDYIATHPSTAALFCSLICLPQAKH